VLFTPPTPAFPPLTTSLPLSVLLSPPFLPLFPIPPHGRYNYLPRLLLVSRRSKPLFPQGVWCFSNPPQDLPLCRSDPPLEFSSVSQPIDFTVPAPSFSHLRAWFSFRPPTPGCPLLNCPSRTPRSLCIQILTQVPPPRAPPMNFVFHHQPLLVFFPFVSHPTVSGPLFAPTSPPRPPL